MPAVTHNAGLPAPRLLRKVFQIQRAKKSLDADVNFAGDAVLRRPDVDAGKFQPLMDAGQIFLIARNAIQCLGDDDCKTCQRAHRASGAANPNG